MVCSFMDLRNKEVVDVGNGEKLGYVDDVEINTETSALLSLVIYGRERLFGILGREEDLIISCDEIELIGKDIILVARENEKRHVEYNKSTNSKKIFLERLYK